LAATTGEGSRFDVETKSNIVGTLLEVLSVSAVQLEPATEPQPGGVSVVVCGSIDWVAPLAANMESRWINIDQRVIEMSERFGHSYFPVPLPLLFSSSIRVRPPQL
jgi:ABC-type uncharacterized transport system YnjBCD permease subunit